jgi:hypothetical protein
VTFNQGFLHLLTNEVLLAAVTGNHKKKKKKKKSEFGVIQPFGE